MKRFKSLIATRKRRLLIFVFVLLLFNFFYQLPSPLFSSPFSTVLYSSSGEIISVKIAEDEQWRISLEDNIADKYKTCLINYEDEAFYSHLGFNPLSLVRAIKQNLQARRIVSGGSTITMQVARLAQQNPPRTIWQKLKELYIAFRIELAYSKEEILKLYANHAPFGGNVVGIAAAGYKYYGRSLQDLSWSEAATLAVLPNSPALIYPGRNKEKLIRKRNFLLKKLLTKNIIDPETYSLALEEELPQEFIKFPRKAPHFLEFCKSQHPNQPILRSTINEDLQVRVDDILNHHISSYSHNHIYNGAILVINNYTNEVISYVGNSIPQNGNFHENYVDIIQAPRSTGSILKPFLHASAIDDGLILNTSLLADIPTIIDGFAPKNYTKRFEGAVNANHALQRSLNIPAVLLLKKYGYPRFHQKLKSLGFSTLTPSADRYGLSLILGGAEATLWDLGKIYSGIAKTINEFEKGPINAPYSSVFFSPPSILLNQRKDSLKYRSTHPLKASACYETFETLTELKRPLSEGGWKHFANSKKIAWKTGTSHGFRDAWAVGVTPRYTVAVWVGNATGEGRPGLVGILKAAPVMFSVFNALPNTEWFKKPSRELYKQAICKYSGMKASENCPMIDTAEISASGKKSALCNYCRTIHLNEAGERVSSKCYPTSKMVSKKTFVLPPVQEWYYAQKSAQYEHLPPFAKNCVEPSENHPIRFIYPNYGSKIYIPREIQGKRSKLICELTHREKGTEVFWHLDQFYIGKTVDDHQMPISYNKGSHTLSVIDQHGNEEIIKFEIL